MKPHNQFQKTIKFLFITCLLFASPLFPQESLKYLWDKIAFPVITIKDSTAINKLADELFIPIDSTVQRLALVDLNFDGPGIKDIIIVYPSYDIYFLELVSAKAARIMRKWPPYDIRSLVITDASMLNSLDSTKISYLPIIKGMQKSIQQHYGTEPIKIFYTRNEDGIQFEILKLPSETKNIIDSTAVTSETDTTLIDN